MMAGFTDIQVLGYVLYAGALALIAIGLYLVVARDHVIRILLGLSLLESGVNLVLVAAGFRDHAVAPILNARVPVGAAMVDPVPQALILTTIVIGVGILALALALALQVQRRFGTLSMRRLALILEQEPVPPATAPVPQAETETRPDLVTDSPGGRAP
jgi:multicomponent Na+:H+ antiporter subunit C